MLFIKAYSYLWNVDVTNKNLEFLPFYLIENTKINFPMFSLVVQRLSSPRPGWNPGWNGLTFSNEKKWLVLTLSGPAHLFVFSNDRQMRSSTDFTLDIPFFPLSEPNQICKETSSKNSYYHLYSSFFFFLNGIIDTDWDQILEEEEWESDWFIVYIER